VVAVSVVAEVEAVEILVAAVVTDLVAVAIAVEEAVVETAVAAIKPTLIPVLEIGNAPALTVEIPTFHGAMSATNANQPDPKVSVAVAEMMTVEVAEAAAALVAAVEAVASVAVIVTTVTAVVAVVDSAVDVVETVIVEAVVVVALVIVAAALVAVAADPCAVVVVVIVAAIATGPTNRHPPLKKIESNRKQTSKKTNKQTNLDKPSLAKEEPPTPPLHEKFLKTVFWEQPTSSLSRLFFFFILLLPKRPQNLLR
jgi:hypothetical protein